MCDDHGCPTLDGKDASAVARHYLRHVGTDWGEAAMDCVLLATSELVTNATIHGGDRPTLDVHTSRGTVRVEVYDSGPTPRAWLDRIRDYGEPAATPADDELRLGGRGLHIVDTLSERWGVMPQPPGKVVWFEMALGA
jgi:anti-sigma regulatory factor (Ser/Thr protein kinase)